MVKGNNCVDTTKYNKGYNSAHSVILPLFIYLLLLLPLAPQPRALETNFDADEDSFENLSTEPQMIPQSTVQMSPPLSETSGQITSEMSGHQMFEKRNSSDNSSENGQHQSNVRRRLSEGLKSFSFRK